jgi:hypothetical protein
MEPVTEALALLHRQAVIEDAMRRPGGIRVNEERDLYALRSRLQKYPAAVQAILDAANRLHRPIDSLTVRDVESN